MVLLNIRLDWLKIHQIFVSNSFCEVTAAQIKIGVFPKIQRYLEIRLPNLAGIVGVVSEVMSQNI